MTKVKKCCRNCGSTNIKIDAWAEWNEKTQEYELSQTFDDAFCEDCEETGSFEDEDIPPQSEGNDDQIDKEITSAPGLREPDGGDDQLSG